MSSAAEAVNVNNFAEQEGARANVVHPTGVAAVHETVQTPVPVDTVPQPTSAATPVPMSMRSALQQSMDRRW